MSTCLLNEWMNERGNEEMAKNGRERKDEQEQELLETCSALRRCTLYPDQCIALSATYSQLSPFGPWRSPTLHRSLQLVFVIFRHVFTVLYLDCVGASVIPLLCLHHAANYGMQLLITNRIYF